ncbi:MAG: hypothetical protein RMM53_08635, partial [Bacteroidia bacterium]|nr:hypothetical protein [Bacteroidia bacterium]
SARKYYVLETSIAPAGRSAWHELMRTDSLLADFEALFEHAQAFLEIFPEDPLGHARLGVAAVETRRFDQALPALERAVKFLADREELWEYLARAYLRTGAPDKAQQLGAKPEVYRVAKIYAEFREGQNADLCLERLPESPDPYVLWTRGRILFLSQRRDQALSLLARAADAQPRYAEAVGDYHHSAGRADKAAYYWNVAKVAASRSAAAKLHP